MASFSIRLCLMPEMDPGLKTNLFDILKKHAFASYFSIWTISHSSQARNQPKVNYEDRTKSFLTDGNCESSMEKTIALLGVQWNVFHCTLGKWNFLFNIT